MAQQQTYSQVMRALLSRVADECEKGNISRAQKDALQTLIDSNTTLIKQLADLQEMVDMLNDEIDGAWATIAVEQARSAALTAVIHALIDEAKGCTKKFHHLANCEHARQEVYDFHFGYAQHPF